MFNFQSENFQVKIYEESKCVGLGHNIHPKKSFSQNVYNIINNLNQEPRKDNMLTTVKCEKVEKHLSHDSRNNYHSASCLVEKGERVRNG